MSCALGGGVGWKLASARGKKHLCHLAPPYPATPRTLLLTGSGVANCRGHVYDSGARYLAHIRPGRTMSSIYVCWKKRAIIGFDAAADVFWPLLLKLSVFDVKGAASGTEIFSLVEWEPSEEERSRVCCRSYDRTSPLEHAQRHTLDRCTYLDLKLFQRRASCRPMHLTSHRT